MARPTIAGIVAMIHLRSGGVLVRTDSITPTNTAADPRARSVPTATPVRSTPEKKNSWNAATPTAANSVAGRTNHFHPGSDVVKMARAINTTAPVRSRSDPTASGLAASGPSSWAVPVVPHRIAANKISQMPRIGGAYSGCGKGASASCRRAPPLCGIIGWCPFPSSGSLRRPTVSGSPISGSARARRLSS